MLPLIIRDMQVAMIRPPTRVYLTDTLPIYEGAPSTFEATAGSSGATIARVDLYEYFYSAALPPVLASATSATAPTTAGAAALWRATWVSGFRTGTRTFAACAFDADGVRACSLSETSVSLLSAATRNTLTLTGPTSTTAGTSYRYTATPMMGAVGPGGQSLTATRVALFDADTREKLGERTATPYEFDLSFGQGRRLLAALEDSNGYETVSEPLAVTSSNLAPIAKISQPITGSEFPAATTLPITVTANDPDGSINRIELWRVGENTAADTLIATSNAATLTYAFLLPNATQTVSVYAYVFDNAGAKIKTAITTFTARADISDPRYFVWTNMNAALKAGNKAAALEFLTPTAQLNYSDTFDLIMPNMAAIVASYSPIAGLNLTTDTADYLLVRIVNSERLVFGLQFVLMDDGIWKLESM